MMKSKHLLLFLAVYTSLFFILFPAYRYIIDPDSTGYFSVAERLITNGFHNSINGIWSPLGSWILAPFIRLGYDEILTQKYLNGFYGLLSLAAFFYFIKKLKIKLFLETAIMIAAVLLILHFVFYRLFGDLLQLIFLLLYLNIICSKTFGNYKSILLAAFICGLGFYAKSYIFYFALIHLPIAIFITERNHPKNKINVAYLKKVLAAFLVLFAIVAFWLTALSSKYGHYILGRQNITGSLSYAYDQPRVPFYAPPFENAYSIFDDISYQKFTNITPFTSDRLFFAELKLVSFNLIHTIGHFNDFSVFFLAIILMCALLILTRFKKIQGEKSTLLLFSFIVIWPSGFLFFHVEPRYLWIMILAVLGLSGILLSLLDDNFPSFKKYTRLAGLLVIAGFYVYPLLILKDQYRSDKNYFEIAAAFKRNNIEGNVLFSNQNNTEIYNSVIINFLAKCRHYGPFTTDYTTGEVLGAIKIYHINYFIFYYTTPYQKDILLSSTLALNAATIMKDIYPGIIVLKFN